MEDRGSGGSAASTDLHGSEESPPQQEEVEQEELAQGTGSASSALSSAPDHAADPREASGSAPGTGSGSAISTLPSEWVEEQGPSPCPSSEWILPPTGSEGQGPSPPSTGGSLATSAGSFLRASRLEWVARPVDGGTPPAGEDPGRHPAPPQPQGPDAGSLPPLLLLASSTWLGLEDSGLVGPPEPPVAPGPDQPPEPGPAGPA